MVKLNNQIKQPRSVILLLAISLASPTCLADAKSDFEAKCTACHGFGVAGAPRLDDPENWAPRLDQGLEVLYSNAINGFTGQSGVMPPKGGFSDLTDQQLRLIVDYMVSAIHSPDQ